MKKLLLLALLAACATKTPPAGPSEPTAAEADETLAPRGWDDALVDAQLAALASTLDCARADLAAPHAFWCRAATGWAKAQPTDLPTRALFVGLTLSLAEGDDVQDWLEQGVHLSALGLLTKDGTQLARIAPIIADTADEKALVAPVEADARALFAGKSKRLTLPAPLADYLKDLPDAASYPLSKRTNSYSFQGSSAAQLRYLGDLWLAIEIPAEGPRGVLITLLTDRVD